jgi:hypothetical protein
MLWRGVLIGKLTVIQLIKKLLPFMELKGPLQSHGHKIPSLVPIIRQINPDISTAAMSKSKHPQQVQEFFNSTKHPSICNLFKKIKCFKYRA